MTFRMPCVPTTVGCGHVHHGDHWARTLFRERVQRVRAHCSPKVWLTIAQLQESLRTFTRGEIAEALGCLSDSRDLVARNHDRPLHEVEWRLTLVGARRGIEAHGEPAAAPSGGHAAKRLTPARTRRRG